MIRTRAQLKAENSADFPNNTARLISPADLRGQMDDIVDSALFPEDDIAGTPGPAGPAGPPGSPGPRGETGITASSVHYLNVAAAEGATIEPEVDVIQTLSYVEPDDGGGATYCRVASEPTLPGKFQSTDGAWWEISGAVLNVRAFGAVGDGVADDAAAIQDALDRGIELYNSQKGSQKVFLPPGRYAISTPLEIFKYVGPDFGYTTVTLCGDASSGYDVARTTTLLPTFNDLPAIFVQKARNVRISGFAIRGLANNMVGVSYEQLIDDEASPWWNAMGARDNPYSPHCAIAIDAFHGTTPSLASGDRYPGYDAYYTSATGGGSSSVMIDDMLIAGFILGVGCSLSQTQIGDSVAIQHCTFTCNKVCISSGQSQVRGLTVYNNHAQFCQVYVDSNRYGLGGGPLGVISGGLVVYCKWLIIANASIDSATIRDLYVESTWAIGTWGLASGSGHSLLIERCHFKLINAVANPGGAGIHAIDAHLQCGPPVTFYGGYIGFNDNFVHRFSIRNLSAVTFDGNVQVDGTPQCADETLVEFKSCRVRFESAGTQYGISREYNSLLQTFGLYRALAPPGCIINDGNTGRRWRSVGGWQEIIVEFTPVAFTVPGDGTATFTTSNHAMLRVGDELTTRTTWYGEDVIDGGVSTQNHTKLLIGEVASIDSGTGVVSLFQVPKYFGNAAAGNPTSYGVWLIELPVIRPITIGTTTSASPTVTGIHTMSGAVTSGWAVGDHIQGTGIPSGARITAIAGTTFTLSHNATASGTVELYDAKLVLEEGSVTAAPSATVAWGKGTFLKNSNLTVKDASNMVLRGWICTASGAPGTWEPQYTSTVSPAT